MILHERSNRLEPVFKFCLCLRLSLPLAGAGRYEAGELLFESAETPLKELHYPNAVVEDVRKLVELHLRFHGYGDGWTDSAVRRYVRDAGPLLDRLNQLTRADCTTRNVSRARKLEQLQDELEERIARLAEEENLSALRPPIDGGQVMKHLGIPPGPLVGEALAYLFELRMERGPIPEDEALELLDAWAEDRDLGI
jgi:poly(A) polymerase